VGKREEARKKQQAAGRRYREKNADKIAEYKRQWRERNQEHRDAYAADWRERNREHIRISNRDYMRRKAKEAKDEVERRTRKAEYARNRYHADLEASRSKARENRQAAQTRDPETYRANKKRHNDAWRAKHKDEINARLREKRLINPSPRAESARRYYEAHAEERRANRRQRYQDNREHELAKQRQWRQREQRRIAVGLPVRRLHRVTPAERLEHARAAEQFFARPMTAELRERLKAELRTPPELIEAWHRDNARFRAAQYALRHPEAGVHVVNRKKAEEERMDAIARQINERLRVSPRTPRDSAPYAPPVPQPSTEALSR